jgi:hypothetical protein
MAQIRQLMSELSRSYYEIATCRIEEMCCKRLAPTRLVFFVFLDLLKRQAKGSSTDSNNPAYIIVGDTINDLDATISGPQADLTLGIKTYVNETRNAPGADQHEYSGNRYHRLCRHQPNRPHRHVHKDGYRARA